MGGGGINSSLTRSWYCHVLDGRRGGYAVALLRVLGSGESFLWGCYSRAQERKWGGLGEGGEAHRFELEDLRRGLVALYAGGEVLEQRVFR